MSHKRVSFNLKTFTDADIKTSPYRILKPDSVTTDDFEELRLNIHLDANNVCINVTVN